MIAGNEDYCFDRMSFPIDAQGRWCIERASISIWGAPHCPNRTRTIGFSGDGCPWKGDVSNPDYLPTNRFWLYFNFVPSMLLHHQYPHCTCWTNVYLSSPTTASNRRPFGATEKLIFKLMHDTTFWTVYLLWYKLDWLWWSSYNCGCLI